jgi:predicted MFS family arabinose efflux permease
VVGEHFSLRSLYWIAVVFFIISNIIMFFTRPQPRDQFDPDAPPERLFSNTRYLTFLFVSFAAMFAMFLPQTLTPNFLQNERGVSLIWLGRLGSLGSLGNVVSNLVIGQMSVRLGFLISQITVVLFAILLWQGSGMVWYGLGYFLLGGYRSARMLVFAQVRSLIHVSQMGVAYGITEAVNALAIILAPLLAGYLYEGSPVSMFPVTVGLLVFSIGVSAVFSPRDHKPEPVPKTSSLQR